MYVACSRSGGSVAARAAALVHLAKNKAEEARPAHAVHEEQITNHLRRGSCMPAVAGGWLQPRR